MTRIGASLSGVDLAVQNNLLNSINQLNKSSLRLSTLKRINSGRDDPAGLIAVEALRSELVALEQASDNADRAASLVRVADSGLSQVGSLLNTIRANVLTAASSTTSPLEQEALQIEIDAALDAIDFIGNITSLGGRNLLDGSAGFEVSGVNSEQIADIQIFSRGGGDATPIDIQVNQAVGAAQLTIDTGSGLADDTTLQLSGDDGTVILELSAGTTSDQLAAAVNATAASTGVTAEVSGDVVTLSSAAVGSDASARVEVVEGSLDVGDGSAEGTDAVVTVNGHQVTGDGNTVRIRDDTLQADIVLTEGFQGQADPITATGAALTFALAPDPGNTFKLALPKVGRFALGGAAGILAALASGGSASVTSGNAAQAISVLDAASNQISSARARAGSFERFAVESTKAVLDSSIVNISSAISSIADADVALESARLVQSQILLNAGIAAVGISGQNRKLTSSLFDGLFSTLR